MTYRDQLCEAAILAVRAFADHLAMTEPESWPDATQLYSLLRDITDMRRPEVTAALDDERLARCRSVL